MPKFSGKVATCCERTRPMSTTWRTGGRMHSEPEDPTNWARTGSPHSVDQET